MATTEAAASSAAPGQIGAASLKIGEEEGNSPLRLKHSLSHGGGTERWSGQDARVRFEMQARRTMDVLVIYGCWRSSTQLSLLMQGFGGGAPRGPLKLQGERPFPAFSGTQGSASASAPTARPPATSDGVLAPFSAVREGMVWLCGPGRVDLK
jgi:hypothetical protein